MGQPLTELGIWLTTVQFPVETVTLGDILQFEIDFKMVALTEASSLFRGPLRQRLLQQESSDHHPYDEAVEEVRSDPSTGPSRSSLVLSIIGYWFPMPHSYCSIPEHYKLIFTNLSPFSSKTPSSAR